MSRRRGRRGMALVAVVGIMSLVALVSVSLLSAAVRLRQGAGNALGDVVLDARLDAVIAGVLAEWTDGDPVALPVGGSRTITPAPGDSVHITRVTARLHLLTGSVSGPLGARRRSSVTIRTPRLETADLSAFVSFTSVTLGDSVIVEQGADSLSCPGPTGAVIMVPPGAQVTGPAGGQISRVSDRAGWGITHLTLAGTSVARLAAAADSVIPAGRTLVLIDGRPRVIRATGDLTVVGEGSALLLVGGRLTLGNVRISGVVVANGGVETIADGAEITGVLIAGRRGDGQASADSRLTHRTTLRFAACVAQDVVAKAVRPWPIRGRAWAELH